VSVHHEQRLKPNRTVLKRELRLLAREFADNVVKLLDEHGLFDEIPAVADETAARVRRSPDALAALCDRLLEVVRSCEEPAAISTLATRLGLSPREVAHPLTLLTERGDIIRTGRRRGARYGLAPAAAEPPAETATKTKRSKAPRKSAASTKRGSRTTKKKAAKKTVSRARKTAKKAPA